MRSAGIRIQKRLLIVRSGVPPGSIKEPSPRGQRTMPARECVDVVPGEKVVRVRSRLGGFVDHDRRADQPPDRDLGDIVLVLAGDTADGGVVMRRGGLAVRTTDPVP